MICFKKTFLAAVIVFVGVSCSKEEADINGYSASVNVVNAIASYEADIKLNFSGGNIIYADAPNLSYSYFDGRYTNGSLTFGMPVKMPTSLIVLLASDTLKPIYSQNYTFDQGDIYSLFITGQKENPSVLFLKDTIPIRTDSTTGVRFVNLAPNSGNISVNISGNPDGSEISALPYKGITSFKTYAARSTNSNYIFQIKDATTGALLKSYTYNSIARFKNITLIIRGMVNGDPGLEIVRFNN